MLLVAAVTLGTRQLIAYSFRLRATSSSFDQRRVRREVADIEHRPQQLRLRQDGLSLRDHTTGAVGYVDAPAFASSLDLAKVRAAVG